MTYDYVKAAATAKRMLTHFGATVTVTRVTPGAYDPVTGGSTDPVTQTWAPKGVKLEYSEREIDGSQIKTGDQRVYMSAEPGLEPQAGDTVTLGSEVWRVVRPRTLAPAGIVVLLDVQVRR